MTKGPEEKLLAEWFWTERWMGSSAFLLPMEAQGLYRAMLTQAWRRGAALPDDHEAVRRACGCTEREWKRSWPKVAPYWRQTGDGRLVNDTQVEVYTDAMARRERAQAHARAGARARHDRLPAKVPGVSAPSPSPSPITEQQTTDERKATRPGSVLGSSPLGEILQPDKTGVPGEAEALREEIRSLEVEVSMLTSKPVELVRTRYSLVPGGPSMLDPARVKSVNWLRTYRDKLLEAKLRARADAFDRPGVRAPEQPDLLAAWLRAQGDDLAERIAEHLAERKAELEAIPDLADRAATRVDFIRAWAKAHGAPNDGAGVVENVGPAIRAAEARVTA